MNNSKSIDSKGILTQITEFIYKISKSTIYSVCMLIFGFTLGVSTVAIHYHILAERNENCEFIRHVEQKMEEFETLDEQYDKLQREIGDLMKEAKVKLVKTRD